MIHLWATEVDNTQKLCSGTRNDNWCSIKSWVSLTLSNVSNIPYKCFRIFPQDYFYVAYELRFYCMTTYMWLRYAEKYLSDMLRLLCMLYAYISEVFRVAVNRILFVTLELCAPKQWSCVSQEKRFDFRSIDDLNRSEYCIHTEYWYLLSNE